MNIFEEKTDSELLSYFSDYQKLCSLDKYTGFQNPDFTAILKSYREKFGPIGEGVLGHDFFEAVFHRWEKTMHLLPSMTESLSRLISSFPVFW